MRPGSSPLAAVLGLGAGLVLGAGIGLPTAHWVAGVLTPPPPIMATPGLGGPPPPSTSPQLSSTPPASAPSTATASPSAVASPPTCAPLASGEQPLDPLRPPPSGYAADAALDWVGCGVEAVPAASPFTVDGPWLVAVSYSCPAGTAAGSGGPTLTVSETIATMGASPEAIVESRADGADVTVDGPGGAALGAGSYRLSVATPSTCLWHLAVYRG